MFIHSCALVVLFLKKSKLFCNIMYRFNICFFKTSNFYSHYKAYRNMSPFNTVTLNAIVYSKRSYSYCKYKYSTDVENALNKQIESEQNAAFTYLNMAVNFLHPSISYPGVGGYFMKMYEEELSHMKILINYQIIRGGTPLIKLNGVDPKLNPDITLVEAFNQALETEKEVTEQLKNIKKIAEATEDYQSADFITTKFLIEQMYAIHELSEYITKLNRLSDDKDAVYRFDSKLSQVYPYSLKS